ncbi:MAG: hypothetical protein IT371_21135 [Deltaproteobacteria bacterium]|nr:hypothetical protein [Deltaproteobacteria bacterium]
MRPPSPLAATLLLGGLALSASAALAQRAPHVPTEEELVERNRPKEDETTARRTQARAVEGTQDKARGAAEWVREHLSGLKVTPARLAAGLGLLGAIYTWPKNKRVHHWLILAALSYVLLAVGLLAIFLR